MSVERVGRTSEAAGYTVLPVTRAEHVFDEYRGTPVAEVLAHHNLGDKVREHDGPQVVVVMCIDPRVRLRIPPNFAFVIRSPGPHLVEDGRLYQADQEKPRR